MTKKRELILRLGVAIYSLCIVCFCFTPQPQLPTGVETPGIQTFGRLVFLLTPLNSLWNLGEVTSLGQVLWIFLQNILNVFLLFPLVFQLIYLCPKLRQTKKITKLGSRSIQSLYRLFLLYSPASTSYRSGNSRYSNFWTPGFSFDPF